MKLIYRRAVLLREPTTLYWARLVKSFFVLDIDLKWKKYFLNRRRFVNMFYFDETALLHGILLLPKLRSPHLCAILPNKTTLSAKNTVHETHSLVNTKDFERCYIRVVNNWTKDGIVVPYKQLGLVCSNFSYVRFATSQRWQRLNVYIWQKVRPPGGTT